MHTITVIYHKNLQKMTIFCFFSYNQNQNQNKGKLDHIREVKSDNLMVPNALVQNLWR